MVAFRETLKEKGTNAGGWVAKGAGPVLGKSMKTDPTGP